MKCSDVKNELYFYIFAEGESASDGKDEFDAGKKTGIENHLKGCPACRGLLAEFSETLAAVDKNPVNYPRKNWDFFASEISERIRRKNKFVLWKPAAALALSTAVFIFGYLYYRQQKTRQYTASAETVNLVSYLSDFDIPELYQ